MELEMKKLKKSQSKPGTIRVQLKMLLYHGLISVRFFGGKQGTENERKTQRVLLLVRRTGWLKK
jgi:hypothetical protein